MKPYHFPKIHGCLKTRVAVHDARDGGGAGNADRPCRDSLTKMQRGGYVVDRAGA
jgi:hypothetical protein